MKKAFVYDLNEVAKILVDRAVASGDFIEGRNKCVSWNINVTSDKKVTITILDIKDLPVDKTVK